MKIRIKWEYGSWWAYFNGHKESYLHAAVLADLCNCIAIAWPVKEWREKNEK